MSVKIILLICDEGAQMFCCARWSRYLLILNVLSTVIVSTVDANIGQVMGWMGLLVDGCPACTSTSTMDNSTTSDTNDTIRRLQVECTTRRLQLIPEECLNVCKTEQEMKEVFDVLTIVLPLLSGFLLSMLHKFDPKLKWCVAISYCSSKLIVRRLKSARAQAIAQVRSGAS
jgi:hypothetical protein|eukprot:COSAG01_NODE_3388_length_6153_cov_2.364057_3_plen_172_part_00